MRLAISRRSHASGPGAGVHLIEVVRPRTNCAALTSAENFFASTALSDPFAVELAADSQRRRFLVRASSEPARQQLMSQLSAAYPQAELRAVPPTDDPAEARADERVAACTLGLRAPAYLPLRTFTDLDVDGERAAQADPVLGILTALGDVPADWRAVSQMILLPAPENWCHEFQRLSVEHPLERERIGRSTQPAAPMLLFCALLLSAILVGFEAYALWQDENWLPLVGLGAATLLAAVALIWLIRRLFRTNVYDMELVREKVTRIACRSELRLIVFAPAETPQKLLESQLERMASAYRRYNLASANALVPRWIRSARLRPSSAVPWSSARRLPVLTTLELAGLWHLPHAAADVALLERTTARRWLPLPALVAEGCRIGTSRHQGREVPVALPADVLQRHLLLVAKTRRGKSTLIQRLARECMVAEPRRAVLLLDPHRDLAAATLGLVPPELAPDVVYLDVAQRDRPFGLNLLDTGLGWDRDRAAANALLIFQREFGDRFWGPRMEDAFRFALLSLFEANRALCETDPVGGRAAQYTLLDVPTMLSDPAFRREVMSTVEDPVVRAWWSDYFEPLDRRFQLELINPVLTKIHRFEGSTCTRRIVGQPASTIDPARWLRDGAIVIVNTARGVVGENASALIGSTLLNLVSLAVAEQARLEAGTRRPISIFVDEFHTIPGADYELILAELSKYGANLILATQSLTRLLAIGGDEGRSLRSTVFANLDGLFAFNCSAEDAEYLVPELGGAVDPQDLVELGEHQCYVRLSSGGERLPTFSIHLDPPLAGDAARATALARASAERYGRDAVLVEADRRSAAARVLQARASQRPPLALSQADASPKAPPRNEHRPRKKRRQPEVTNAA